MKKNIGVFENETKGTNTQKLYIETRGEQNDTQGKIEVKNIIMKSIEKLQNNEFPINPLKVENGVVIVDNGQLFHSFLASIGTLKAISKAGIVASEWFGILEDEAEAYCCAFLNQLQEELPYKESPKRG